MPRTSAPKQPSPSKAERNEAVVRTENIIPTMDLQVAASDQAESPKALVCSGHCGRCEVSPCQLHAKLAFRI